MIRCFAPAMLAMVLGACSSGGDRSEIGPTTKPTPLIASEVPPADFTLGVTVLGPPADEHTARSDRPARYIIQPDRILHSTDWVVTDEIYPPMTRLLTHEQTQRLWWDLRDSGFLTPGHPAAVGAWKPGELDKSVAVTPVFVVSYAAEGARRQLVIDPRMARSEDVSAARRLADRLATLAWIGQ